MIKESASTISPLSNTSSFTSYSKEDYNDLTGFLKSNSPKKTFSFTNILTWIIFFPIKLAWWILKSIWHNDHMASKWR